ncbi:hypothetical protein RchiOBHm_Chr5g0007281 [Rosa chinensis]|uniref:Secreted protein n=1 Tax=Rosa chinensis TaxID=74649 RepID=A0A2P6Q3T5_ROSCH|nr:hypothetical protein RchiOBHm_Chr5g0007281 [Rosa chinensis]
MTCFKLVSLVMFSLLLPVAYQHEPAIVRLIPFSTLRRGYNDTSQSSHCFYVERNNFFLCLQVVENGNPLERNIWKDIVFQTLFVLSC